MPNSGETTAHTSRTIEVIHDAIVAVVDRSFWMMGTAGRIMVST